MSSGFDARVGIATETVYGTRVAPAKFLPLTAEDLGYSYNRYFSPALGTGMWGRPSVITTQVGSGSLTGDVTTTGMGYLLKGLHGNTVTPTQLASTTAYAQTHTLNTPPDKSYSIQVQNPPRSSNTLIPHDMLGVMFGSATFSWAAEGVLSYSIDTVYRELDLSQSNASYVAPTDYTLFGFKLGSVTIGGVAAANIIGDGSFSIAYPLDQVHALGSNGMIAKPAINDKPTAEGTFTAAFENNDNLNRVINNTIADVVLKFEGATIASTYKYTFQITIPDCVFTTQRSGVTGPGPLSQTVSFTAASATADPPVIYVISTDTSL